MLKKLVFLKDYFYLDEIIDVLTLYLLVFGKFWDYRYTLTLFFKIFCPQCEIRATHEGNLVHHMKQVHKGAKYECN